MPTDIDRFLRFRHHEALMVTLDEGLRPHTAPMGVEYVEARVLVRPYVNTKTFHNLKANPEVSLNFTQDSRYFFEALLKPDRLRYRIGRCGRVPVIEGSFDLYIEGRVNLVDLSGERGVFVVYVSEAYEGPGSRLAFSRANNALLEALVYYTKVKVMIREGFEGEVSDYLGLIKLNLNLVRRIGGRELVSMADELEDVVKGLVGGALRQG
ncbi:MAG: DUF447 family protein [Zestosphaera sp.]